MRPYLHASVNADRSRHWQAIVLQDSPFLSLRLRITAAMDASVVELIEGQLIHVSLAAAGKTASTTPDTPRADADAPNQLGVSSLDGLASSQPGKREQRRIQSTYRLSAQPSARVVCQFDVVQQAVEIGQVRHLPVTNVSHIRRSCASWRGLLIVVESNYRERLEVLGNRIRRVGMLWSQTPNLAEVPLFTRTSRTRLLQTTGLVTNAAWETYEMGPARDVSQFLPSFDRAGEQLHGLTHISADAAQCMAPCSSWRVYNTLD